jgi:hypothetical protein
MTFYNRIPEVIGVPKQGVIVRVVAHLNRSGRAVLQQNTLGAQSARGNTTQQDYG